MTKLQELRAASQAAEAHLYATIDRLFPEATIWHWYRAVEALRGANCRRNDDTSRDEALNASVEIREAHEAFIKALHAFYLLRDGLHGVLGRIAS